MVVRFIVQLQNMMTADPKPYLRHPQLNYLWPGDVDFCFV